MNDDIITNIYSSYFGSEKIILPKKDTELRNGLIVAKSQIEGLGLFADRAFTALDVIWFEQLASRFAKPESGGPLRWANHSDQPNSMLCLGQGDGLKISLLALTDIQEGEEITYNYGIFGHTGHKADCNCGQSNCKGYFTLREEWGELK
jgi:SET domain-containing protein